MANRRRYKDVERVLTMALLADLAVFVLFLIFSGLGWTALKVISVILIVVVSGLCLAFLYMCGEMKKRRSRWLVMGYGAIVVCMLVSLLLNYPSPNPNAEKKPSEGTSSSTPADPTESLPPVVG